MLVATQLDPFDGSDRFTYGEGDFLDYQTEHALLFGLGSNGNVVMRELPVWAREWAMYRDRLLPKFIAAFPGKRPAAAYIVGELPLRPMQTELPLSSKLRHTRCVYVNCGPDGFTYGDLPEPYQRDEARHLHDVGIVDADELRRYCGYSRTAGLAVYRWEAAG